MSKKRIFIDLVEKQTRYVEMASIRFAVVLAIIMVVLALSADAAYRKPPFNGSIFGKRSSTATGKHKFYTGFLLFDTVPHFKQKKN